MTKRFIEGSWPERCEQRAFVEGAQWWEFHSTGGTMWASDRNLAEVEAIRRFGEPPPRTHGYGCPHDGEPLTDQKPEDCPCDETGWAESVQGEKRGD